MKSCSPAKKPAGQRGQSSCRHVYGTFTRHRMDGFQSWMLFVQVLPKSEVLAELWVVRCIKGTAAEESSAIKISQQLLIGFSFDVRRHSPWDGRTEALFLRELYSISVSKSPHQLLPSSPLHETHLFLSPLIGILRFFAVFTNSMGTLAMLWE